MESDCRLEEGAGLEEQHRRESQSLNLHEENQNEEAEKVSNEDVINLSEMPSPSRESSEAASVQCPEAGCSVVSASQEEWSKHNEEAHGGRKFRCSLCQFSCLTHGGLYLHNNAVHLGIRFRCDKCSYEGTQEVNLKRHIESKHGNVLYCCKLCNVQTRVSYYAENHLKKKHGICSPGQQADCLERKAIWPRDGGREETEEERQLEEEMEEEEVEDEDDYLDPSELLEQSDLMEEDPEASSSIQYPGTGLNMDEDEEEEEDSVPDLEFLDTSGDTVLQQGFLKHKSPQFQCKKCDYAAPSSGTLTRHVSVVHKGVRWSCRLCGYVTTVKCSMVRHVQSIHQGWRYKCPFCDHESTQKGGLKYHIEKKHQEQNCVPRWGSLAPVKTRCSGQLPGIENMDVNQMFDELSDSTTGLEQHTSHQSQREECNSSGVEEGSAHREEGEVGELEEEQKEQEGSPEAPGHYVGEDYDFTELYSRFTGVEDVPCDLCTYSTARMGNMRRHVLAVHQGIRFPCNLCTYRAPDKGSLLRHTRGVHQGIRYYCDFCTYSATQKGNLKKHQEMKHKDNFYDCTYCDFRVNWKGSFIKHMQHQHGDLMSAQGLGTTGETNPLLSFNVNTFTGGGQEEQEQEDEEEFNKTEDRDTTPSEEEEPGPPTDAALESYQMRGQNMSAEKVRRSEHDWDRELEGSKVVVKTETSPVQKFKFKMEEEEEIGVVGGEDNISEENGLACTFQCTLCNYTANSSASLARHNGAVHKGIRWQCKDCDFITRDKSSLKRHRRNRHDGIRFKCNYCDYDAGQKGNIKSHMDRKHPEIPYDHTEFQEVRVEKSKFTREAKQERESWAAGRDPLALGGMPGLLGLQGLVGLAGLPHLLSSLLQARAREENTSFLSTDEDSNLQSSDREGEEEVTEEEEQGSPPSPSPGPSLTSTPLKDRSSLLLSALQALPSSSPTLTPTKSILDLLNISSSQEEEEEARLPCRPLVTRTRREVQEEGEGLGCQECDFRARSQGTLFRHIQSVHRGVRFTCDYCDFVTIDKGSLKRHVNGQHKGLKHKCDFCEYENAQIGNVKKHIQTKHQNLVYQCPYCNLEAKHKWYLEQHVRKLHTEKLFVFDINSVTPQPSPPPLAPLLPPHGLLPPALLLLHPMAKFLVPELNGTNLGEGRAGITEELHNDETADNDDTE